MCFSATASFSASIVIGIAGLVTFKSCKKNNQKFLGAVPFLFAMQQLSEGFVWLSFTNANYHHLQHFFTICFLTFAWVVWPVLIPIAFYKLEPDGKRKEYCRKLIYVGIACGIYAIFNMAVKYPVPNIATFHIIYKVTTSYYHQIIFFPHQTAYVLATVLPMFLSSLKGVKLLAYSNFISLILAFYFFQYALPSTWCFFAAFLSALIFWILKKHNQYILNSIPQKN